MSFSIIKFFLFFFLLLQAAVSFGAGLGSSTLVGNGGDVVVCRNAVGAVNSIELLDYYEARLERGLLTQFEDNLSYSMAVEVLLSRLEKHDLYTPEVLRLFISNFMDEAQFVSGVTLTDIPDSHHLFYPRGCGVEQIAIQRTPRRRGDKRYFINKDLWNSLSGSGQAGLVFHEVLLRMVINYSEEDVLNSSSVRYFLSLLASDSLKMWSEMEYRDFIGRELNLSYAYEPLILIQPREIWNIFGEDAKRLFLIFRKMINTFTDMDGEVVTPAIEGLYCLMNVEGNGHVSCELKTSENSFYFQGENALELYNTLMKLGVAVVIQEEGASIQIENLFCSIKELSQRPYQSQCFGEVISVRY